MKAYTKALAALAVAAIMCICPAIVMADGSEAITVTEGEKALSVEIDDLTEAQINQLYSSSTQEGWAKKVLDSFVNYSALYEITEVKVTDLSVERALGSKVTSDCYKSVDGTDIEFTISFKATAQYDTNIVFDENKGLFPVIKAIGTDNTGKAGDVYNITSEVKITDSGTTKENFAKTDSGIYVDTGGYSESYSSKTYDTSVTLTKKTDSSTVKFDVYSKSEYSTVYNNEIDTNGTDVADLTNDSVVYESRTIDTKTRVELKGSADGDSETDVTTTANSGSDAYVQEDPAIPVDIGPQSYTLVGLGTAYSLFDVLGIGDDGLKTDDGMKTFLDGIGDSPSDSYSDAQSITEDAYSTIVSDEDLAVGILAIAIGALVLLLVVLVIVIVIILIVKRKKK